MDNQLRDDVIRGGFPSWNVRLGQSINAMPAVQQYDPITSEGSKIQSFRQLAESNVLMSTTDIGSVNLWATKVGLVNVGAFNFKLQAYSDHKGEMSRAKLLFENLPCTEGADGVKLFKNSDAAKEPKSEEREDLTKEEVDEGEGGVLQALFDQTEFDASIEAAVLDAAEESLGVQLVNLQGEFDKVPSGEKQGHVSFQAKLQASLAAAQADSTKPDKDALKNAIKESAKKTKEKSPKGKFAKQFTNKPKEDKDAINKEYMKVLMDMGFNEKLSRAALGKVENQGVTEAVEVAIKLQGEPEYQEAAPPKAAAKVALRVWKCPQCTLENPAGKSVCDVCGGECPPEALVNDEEESKKKAAEEEAEKKKKEEEEQRKKDEEEAKIRE